jgi:hypothetical protein
MVRVPPQDVEDVLAADTPEPRLSAEPDLVKPVFVVPLDRLKAVSRVATQVPARDRLDLPDPIAASSIPMLLVHFAQHLVHAAELSLGDAIPAEPTTEICVAKSPGDSLAGPFVGLARDSRPLIGRG